MFPFSAPAIIKSGVAILKPQDVFATSLWTDNGSTQAITNGIDLAGKGGLVWTKSRSNAFFNRLSDTLRGPNKELYSNDTSAEAANGVTAFGPTGFTSPPTQSSGTTNVSWAFARAPKFFDIVTWTGDGTSNRQIPHGLGVVPGMVIVKSRSAREWIIHHRSINGGAGTVRFDTQPADNTTPIFSATSASNFTMGGYSLTNQAGEQFVALVIAHDPSADGIVQCGVSTSDGGGAFTIPHGWAGGAQWLIYKNMDTSGTQWFIADSARNTPNFSGADRLLKANSSDAEFLSSDFINQSSGVLTIADGGTNVRFIWATIRAPY